MKVPALLAVVLLLLVCGVAGAQFRFPMPEFESDYEHPSLHTPPPERDTQLFDAGVLLAALGIGAWLVLKRRSRAGVFTLTVVSLLYFGFWRKGCVCPVGSLQNVVAAIVDENAGVSLGVLAFFLLPLLFALFFGRIFCAGVCPLGAIQEMVAVRPVAVHRPTERLLGLIPYLYLGLTVLAVSTGAGFLICRYDPFVGFFRQGASFNMLLAGGVLLLAGVFIGRPYCRFLCPYGVLLGWMSRFSKWHASIPPTECIQCRLCEDSCPYGAINKPTPPQRPLSRKEGAKRLGVLLALAPFVVAAGAAAGVASHHVLARLHPTVRLAERIAEEERGYWPEMTLESETFRAGRETSEELYAEAHAIRSDFKGKAGWLGAFLGLVIACKLIGLSMVRTRTDYEPDRAACVSCARCFAYCPVGNEDGGIKERET